MAGVFDDPSMLFSNTTWCRCLGGREAHLTSNNVLCRLYHSVQCFAVEGGAVPTPDSVAANRDVLHSACIKLFEGFGAQTELPPLSEEEETHKRGWAM